MQKVTIAATQLARMESAVGIERVRVLRDRAAEVRDRLGSRTIWNINSTAQGGGVAEMLLPLIGYARGLDLDVRWLVIEGDPTFFTVTKRLHNRLHGHAGDGGSLGAAEHRAYWQTTVSNQTHILEKVRPGDVVICHDPQTAGLVEPLVEHGATVIWRCHIGHDRKTELTEGGWGFLAPFLQDAHGFVFTRWEYVPSLIAENRVSIIAPSIDPLSVKNQPMTPEAAHAILITAGLLDAPPSGHPPLFHREDGAEARVTRRAEVLSEDGPPSPDRQWVVQVSRWDRLKDPLGVLRGFLRHGADDSACLVLAGPSVTEVSDDPEGAEVLNEVRDAWRNLPPAARRRVFIVCLPMDDRDENAAIVNALQRQAAIVVQKSLQEGFGLTVTEAMWKARCVVASAVGGIQDQIQSDVDGCLLDDPTDEAAFARAIERLLGDPARARRLGDAAHIRVRDHFLFDRHLLQYAELLDQLVR